MDNCIFCKIIKGEIPSKKVYEDEDILAFFDINPVARVHVLIVPKKHIASLNEIEKEDEYLIGKLHMAAKNIALEQGIFESGYRLITNCGDDAGQEVKHIHFHLLGGEKLKWSHR